MPMNAKPVPLHCQSPAKYFNSFSFGLGPGGASAARTDEVAKARARIGKRTLFIASSPFRLCVLAGAKSRRSSLAYLTPTGWEQRTKSPVHGAKRKWLDSLI